MRILLSLIKIYFFPLRNRTHFLKLSFDLVLVVRLSNLLRFLGCNGVPSFFDLLKVILFLLRESKREVLEDQRLTLHHLIKQKHLLRLTLIQSV